MAERADIADMARRIPLLADLDADDLRYVFRAAQPLSFASGDLLVRQGQSADSALFMARGRAQVINALPGGGETVVGELGPGGVLGEMALLDHGVRSASVVATEPTACLSMARDAFRMLIAQGNQAVLAINRRITLSLCQRLRELNGKILALSPPEQLAPALTNRRDARQPCAFDFRAFLGLLPALRDFSVDEAATLLQASQVFDLPRGALLFSAGEPGTACYLVVRGALEISREQAHTQRRIGILGPGRLCGVLGLIEGRPHSMSASAREQVTLMEIPATAFARYYDGQVPESLKFQHAVNQELLQSLARTNNHLTRLISQARIRHHAQQADALHGELLGQDYRAAARD